MNQRIFDIGHNKQPIPLRWSDTNVQVLERFLKNNIFDQALFAKFDTYKMAERHVTSHRTRCDKIKPSYVSIRIDRAYINVIY